MTTSNEWYMGVILTSLASLVGTVGKILFKVAHTAEARANLYDSHGDLAQAKHERLQSRLTWAAGAIGIMVLNPVGDTAAYAFASQSMLVPFAALSIVWNTLCAPWLLHEKITKRDLFGTTIIVGGCTLVAVSSSHSPVVYTASSLAARFYAPWFLAFVFFMCSAAALLCHLLSTRHTGSIAHRIAAGALGGVIGGNLYLVKCTTLLLLMPRPRPWWTYPGNYVVAAGAALSAGGGLMFLSRALSWYPAVTVIPVYQSSLIIFGCMSAAAFFDDEGIWILCYEREGSGPRDIGGFQSLEMVATDIHGGDKDILADICSEDAGAFATQTTLSEGGPEHINLLIGDEDDDDIDCL